MAGTGRMSLVVAAALVAACSKAPSVPTTRQAAAPATVVGDVGTKARVALPRLGPTCFAEIQTRAVLDPAEAGGTERHIDSLCDFWADEGVRVGALGGWTISGEWARGETANLRMAATATALDGKRVRYEIEASWK
jgi:hypothetical protein